MKGIKADLIEIVGKNRVQTDLETLGAHSCDHSFVMPIKPRFVVKPQNVGEIQKIVKWANQTKTPLVPVSSGPPHFRGDTVPCAPEAVIVDLSGMNRILRIDRRNRLALVEPGVTYSQLQPELANTGLRLSTPLLPRANKSVMASLLEREPTIVPRFQWTMLEPLRSLEVVWGNGDRLWTGAGEIQGDDGKGWESGLAPEVASGPAQLDYYRLLSASQGSMGIVTWASVKCEILPQLHRLFFVTAQKLEDLIDFTYRLLRFRFGDELLLLNRFCLASILGESADRVRALAAELPAWSVLVGIAGRDILPKERVAYQDKDIGEIARQHGLQLVPEIPGARDSEVLETILNPSKEPYWKLRYKGSSQDIFFLTTLNRANGFTKTVHLLARAHGYPASEIGVYIQPVHQGVGCHCEFNLPFDPTNSKEADTVRRLYIEASEELIKQGAFFSRPYGIWAKMALNRDAQNMIVLKKVKEIFDPNNIMNPGKLCF